MEKKYRDLTAKRNLNIKEASAYIGLGRTRTRELMDSIGATLQIGRRVVFDKEVIDDFINENRGVRH